MITADELRNKYIEFFTTGERAHVQIPSASLVPENDPTVLFTTAGMHPLVPFLLGEPHPAGKRLVNCQRCIRTSDIDLVGDDVHLTFFEMLGNWSLGDPASPDGIGEAGYWKPEAIRWSWEFLTGKEWLGLDPERIFVTCFAGDSDAPRDDETAKLWHSVGVKANHIAFLSKADNWWGPAGQTGPCGPDTEMFYQVNTTEDERPGDADWPKGKYVEIWNDVFMQYNKTADGRFEPLVQKNVDTGMGVERTLAVLNEFLSVFQTDVFSLLLKYVRNVSQEYNEVAARIIVDHLKAVVFLIADGVVPSNKERGYIVRRLLRESVTLSRTKIIITKLDVEFLRIAEKIIDYYKNTYPYLAASADTVRDEMSGEISKFTKSYEVGLREIRKIVNRKRKTAAASRIDTDQGSMSTDYINVISGKEAFDVYQNFGFPVEAIELVLSEYGMGIHMGELKLEFKKELNKHQDLSRKGAEQKFKGGLADRSEVVVRMHTATHLLHQALRDVLGSHVAQKGSNITAERLRFDFTHPQKMTDEQKSEVEKIVNQKISEAIPVERMVLPLAEARKLGAIGLFGEKYGETVSVYLIGDYSKEFCGGPHVQNTREIGRFKITKEEAVSAGIRRIKAVVASHQP